MLRKVCSSPRSMMSAAKLIPILALLVFSTLTPACRKKMAPPAAREAAQPEAAASPAAASEQAPQAPTATAEPAKAETAQNQSPALMRINDAGSSEEHAKMLTDALTTWEDWFGGKAPTSLQQLVEKKIVNRIPAAPQGKRFVIDPRKHAVVLQSQQP